MRSPGEASCTSTDGETMMNEAELQLLRELKLAVSRTASITESTTESRNMSSSTVTEEPCKTGSPHLSEPPASGPLKALAGVMLNGEFSDMFILLKDGQEIKGHRALVLTQSNILAAAYITDPGTLDLSADDPKDVIQMLEYMYTGEYAADTTAPEFGLSTHVAMHGLASKYQIPGLIEESVRSFHESLSQVSDLETYFACIKTVYDEKLTDSPDSKAIPSRALRDECITAAVLEMRNLVTTPLVTARFLEIFRETPSFLLELLQAYADLKEDYEAEMQNHGDFILCENCGPARLPYSCSYLCVKCGKSCTVMFH